MANTQSKEWLKSAYSDLRSIKYIIKDDFLTHVVAFHSQQAVEKTLKAVIEYKNKRVPRVHKLQNLIHRIDIDIVFEESILETLDELYIDSRYPGDIGLLPHGKPTLNDAKAFYDFSQTLFEDICKVLDIDINELLD
jgi:HEPN domain-containing protein